MANGIGNNESKERLKRLAEKLAERLAEKPEGTEKKVVNIPAGKDDKTVVCVARLKPTEKGLFVGVDGKKVKGCKEQLKSGEYVTIKLSDKPLQINRSDNEAGR